MPDDSFQRLVSALREYVRLEVDQSPRARDLALRLGEWLVEIAKAPSPGAPSATGATAPTSAPAATSTPPPLVQRPTTALARTLPTSQAVVPLKLGDVKLHVPVAGTSDEIGRARAAAVAQPAAPTLVDPILREGAAIDLSLIVSRCRLKARACRLYIRRRAAEGDPPREPAVLDEMTGMLNEGKALPGCFIWVFWRHEQQPSDADLTIIADGYDALAEACAHVQRLDQSADAAPPADVADAMQMLAEATSALRIALTKSWLRSPDADQDESHLWLRRETALRRVFVARHMRLEDPADPAQSGALIARLRDLESRQAERAKARKKVATLISQVRFHAKHKDEAGALGSHDARKVLDALDALHALGLRHDDARIAEAMGTPPALPADAQPSPFALRVLQHAAAPTPADADEPPFGAPEREWSTQVQEARALLRGSGVVVVGGERRQDAVDRLTSAFDLADVEWVRLNEHGSSSAMGAPISRRATSVVLVLIKLTGHLHAEEAREHARRAGKPCVYLKAGYNPEQVADAVLQQAAEQLRARVPVEN